MSAAASSPTATSVIVASTGATYRPQDPLPTPTSPPDASDAVIASNLVLAQAQNVPYDTPNLLLCVRSPLNKVAPTLGTPQPDGSCIISHSTLETLIAYNAAFSPGFGRGLLFCHHQLSVPAMARILSLAEPFLLLLPPAAGPDAASSAIRDAVFDSLVTLQADSPAILSDADLMDTDNTPLVVLTATGNISDSAQAQAQVAAAISSILTLHDLLDDGLDDFCPGHHRGRLFGYLSASCPDGRGTAAARGASPTTQVLLEAISIVLADPTDDPHEEISALALNKQVRLSWSLIVGELPEDEFIRFPATSPQSLFELSFLAKHCFHTSRTAAVCDRALVYATNRALVALAACLTGLDRRQRDRFLREAISSLLPVGTTISAPTFARLNRALQPHLTAVLDAPPAERLDTLLLLLLLLDSNASTAARLLEERADSATALAFGGGSAPSNSSTAGPALTTADISRHLIFASNPSALSAISEFTSIAQPTPVQAFYALACTGECSLICSALSFNVRKINGSISLVIHVSNLQFSYRPYLLWLATVGRYLSFAGLIPSEILDFNAESFPSDGLTSNLTAALTNYDFSKVVVLDLSILAATSYALDNSLNVSLGNGNLTSLTDGLTVCAEALSPLLRAIGLDAYNPTTGLAAHLALLTTLCIKHNLFGQGPFTPAQTTMVTRVNANVVNVLKAASVDLLNNKNSPTREGLLPMVPSSSPAALEVSSFFDADRAQIAERRRRRAIHHPAADGSATPTVSETLLPALNALKRLRSSSTPPTSPNPAPPPRGQPPTPPRGARSGARPPSAPPTSATSAAGVAADQLRDARAATTILSAGVAATAGQMAINFPAPFPLYDESNAEVTLGRVVFSRAPLEAKLSTLGYLPGTYSISTLLVAHPNPTLNMLLKKCHPTATNQSIVVPHADWYKACMAKPFLLSMPANSPEFVQAYFR